MQGRAGLLVTEMTWNSLHAYIFPLQDDSLTKERLNTYVVSASIENASVQNLNEPVTITLQHRDQNMV